jgi:hypothetical protein
MKLRQGGTKSCTAVCALRTQYDCNVRCVDSNPQWSRSFKKTGTLPPHTACIFAACAAALDNARHWLSRVGLGVVWCTHTRLACGKPHQRNTLTHMCRMLLGGVMCLQVSRCRLRQQHPLVYSVPAGFDNTLNSAGGAEP